MKPQSALVLSACMLASPASHAQRPEVGKPFPIQLFPELGAKGLKSLKDFRGKKVLLMQFASW